MTESLSEEKIRMLSETMGHMVVDDLNSQDIQINFDSLIKGIEEALEGRSPPLSKKQYFHLLMTQTQKIHQIKTSENLKIAEDFLYDNKKKEGIVSLEKGQLQYQTLKEGTGKTVHEESAPLIEYEGKLINGQVFDSSAKRGNPITLPLESAIPGFRKGVAGMKEGEKRRLFIHPDLGYGSQGRLPPNSLLIFEIEVIKAGSDVPPFKPPYKHAKGRDALPQKEKETSSRWTNRLSSA
jgi:peptidylprolyl isomerase